MPTNTPADARGQEPLFIQVTRRLRGEIAGGRLPAGQRLAPERELCRRYGISRNTLRRALVSLSDDGFLTAAGRHGWYVASSPVVESAQGPASLTGWAAEAQISLTSRVVRSGLRRATVRERDALGLGVGEQVYALERVRIVDGAALSLDLACLPGSLAPALHGVDFSTASLYDTLRDRAGRIPGKRDCLLRADIADERTAKLLEVPAGSPLLVVSETVADQDGRPLEYSILANRGDRWGYRATYILPEVATG